MVSVAQKNGLCPFPHPSPCQRYTKDGTSTPKGCQKGPSCPLWHPTYICKNSGQNLSCPDASCRFLHHRDCSRPNNNYPHFLNRNRPRHIPPLMSVPTRPPYPIHPMPHPLQIPHYRHLQQMMFNPFPTPSYQIPTHQEMWMPPNHLLTHLRNRLNLLPYH